MSGDMNGEVITIKGVMRSASSHQIANIHVYILTMATALELNIRL
jgi:hypothetical protein